MAIRANASKRAGPLPRWAWALLVVGGALAAYYLYRRNRPGQDTSTGFTSTSIVPVGATAQLAAQSNQPSTNAAPADSMSPDVVAALGEEQTTLATILQDLLANQASLQPGFDSSTGTTTGPMAASAPLPAPASTSGALPVVTVAAPYGGVVSKIKTKGGATITTYRSGRKVEQAPGKSPYVVKK